MGYQRGARFRNHWGEPAPSLSLNIRRVESVRSAFYQAQWQAADLLRRRFADLEISIIIDDLIDVVTQMVGPVFQGSPNFRRAGVMRKLSRSFRISRRIPETQWSKPDMRGYTTASSSHEGVDIKVVYDTVKDRVVTGYPTNTPKNPKP